MENKTTLHIPRSRRISPYVCLLVSGIVLSTSLAGDARSQDRSQREDAIWERSDDELQAYMKESVLVVATGHERAYSAFIDWYTNVHLPALDSGPAVEKIFKFVVQEGLLRATTLIPYGGVFGDLLNDFAKATAGQLSRKLGPVNSKTGLDAALNNELSALKLRIVTLPQRFDNEHPGEFEEAMFSYFNEEVETPGIHDASPHNVGEETRALLRDLGFPEPNESSGLEVAESILQPMIRAAKAQTSKPNSVLEPWMIDVDARYWARRALHPDDSDYYCEGTVQLGRLAPDECR